MLDYLHLLFWLVYTCIRSIVVTFIPARLRAKSVTGQVCLITGSGSGFGKQMALRFSKLGCKMVLVDINKEWLAKSADECRSAGAQAVHTFTCDLADRQQVYLTTEKIKSEAGSVDILINNAGIVSAKPILELDDSAHIERTFKINVLCHFWLIKAFLPEMLRKDRGHIVTVSSMAGISCASPKLVDYASSKYAAVGLAETLDFELRCHYNTTAIKQTVVCPYFASTGMFSGVSLKREWMLPYLTAEYVADKTVEAVLINKPIVMLPPWLRVIACLKYVLPLSFWYNVADFLGVNRSMDTFVGRQKQN